MNAEFNWWLLIVGLVVGAGLVWFVLSETRRRDADIDARERSQEAVWMASVLADEGMAVTPATVERMLALHVAYLEAPPPDDPPDAPSAPEVRGEPERAADPAGSEIPGDDRVGREGGAADLGQ